MAEQGEGGGFARLVLGWFGYGPGPADLAAFVARGFGPWLETQLAPPPGDDPEVVQRLAQVRLNIKYPADAHWPAVNEQRPLASLDRPIEALWPLLDAQPRHPAERAWPRYEVIAATLIRAIYSRYPLREVLAQFWRDHFNVNAFGPNAIAVALPVYDREVIRKHALGNFRALLEAVAGSTAMLYYLSNRSSRAGAANENYARELFELHTLGRDAYLNDQYNRWRDVPGAVAGRPEGYIDQDVYEAARAFTGWEVEDGTALDGQRKLPATGRFAYVETWHDGYQKRVLGQEFNPFAAALDDGGKVLDWVAHHPATARHLAGKLCRRYVGSDAPPELVGRIAEVWTRTTQAPDQIAQVVANNKSQGTDHGRGGLMAVLGGKVAGGRCYGPWPGLRTGQLEEGVDLAVTTDYWRVLAEVLGWQTGAKGNPWFPGYDYPGGLGLFAGGRG
ncbi:Protein of unknown function [Methylomagnum ishizawai]|uniref:DUF1800 domain-containing protein n=2 Tax=Methylomagnum ishizawai TaxID=1760988 RepID=A0A1Y6D533_9GAMM|nr:Protein of unknown function [Methylomagnum ishizawai]